MLYTNLTHLENAESLEQAILENNDVTVICGRMDPECIHVFRVAERLAIKYKHIRFFDLECDNPEFDFLKELMATNSTTNCPVTIYYKNGKQTAMLYGNQLEAQLLDLQSNTNASKKISQSI